MNGRLASTIDRVLLAAWLGGGIFLAAVAAPAAFSASPDRTAAAGVVGAMLARWHYMAIAIPVYLVIRELTRNSGARTAATVILTLVLLLASAQALVDLRIRDLRLKSRVPISSLRPSDPVRRHFGMLHGISSSLLILQLLAGVALVASTTRHENAAPSL